MSVPEGRLESSVVMGAAMKKGMLQTETQGIRDASLSNGYPSLLQACAH